jgi:hypothetical protein
VKPRDVIRVKPSTVVRVTRSNSAFYTCAVEATATVAPEVTALQTFGSLAGAAVVPVIDVMSLTGKSATRSELDDLNRLLLGKNGLRDVQSRVLDAIDAMVLLELQPRDSGLVSIATPLKGTLYADTLCDTSCVRLTLIPKLRKAFDAVEARLFALESGGAPSDSSARPTIAEQIKALKEASAARDRIMALALHTGRLMALVANATDDFTCDTVTMPRTEGRKLDLAVKPRTEPELAVAARRPPYSTTVTLNRDWLIRPAASIALMYARDRTFDTFGTRTVGTAITAGRTGTATSRANLGVTLGLTWRGLDGRDGRLPVTIWLPEVSANPAGDARAVGVGTAVSMFRFLKVGAGMMWTRRTVLDGQSLGEPLLAATDLRTKVIYDNGRDTAWKGMYVSLSLTGFAPFVPKAP